MPPKVTALVLTTSLLGLAGCGPNYSPNTYSAEAVQQANKVERGVIVGVRAVGVSAETTGGTVTGAAAGGIAGSQVGAGPIAALGALSGSVVGGLVGTSVQHATGDTRAFEYVVRQADGSLVSVTQKDKEPLEIGQTVLVIAGKQARIVPDYTVTVPWEPSPAVAANKPAAKPAETPKPAAETAAKPEAAASSAPAGAQTAQPAAADPTAAPAPASQATAATSAAPSSATPAAKPAPPATEPTTAASIASAAPGAGTPISVAIPAPAATQNAANSSSTKTP